MASAGRLTVDGKVIVLQPGEAPADPVLVETLAALDAGLAGQKARDAVKKLDKEIGGVWPRIIDRMVGAGTLGRDKDGLPLALAGPCRLLEKVAPERDQHRHAKARIEHATERAPFGPEVKKIIDELVASAAMIGAVAGVAGAAGSS